MNKPITKTVQQILCNGPLKNLSSDTGGKKGILGFTYRALLVIFS